jgi:hypothetical protein
VLENLSQWIDARWLGFGNLYEIAPFYVLIVILMIGRTACSALQISSGCDMSQAIGQRSGELMAHPTRRPSAITGASRILCIVIAALGVFVPLMLNDYYLSLAIQIGYFSIAASASICWSASLGRSRSVTPPSSGSAHSLRPGCPSSVCL